MNSAPVFVLVPSPLVGAAVFEPLERALSALGRSSTIVEGCIPAEPPYWEAFSRSIAARLPVGRDIVLVGHSGAGPGLGTVAAASENVRVVLHMDATLVAPGHSWLDTFDPETLARPEFAQPMARGMMPNPWMSPELWRKVGVEDERVAARLSAGCRELPLAWYREPAPAARFLGPNAYVAFTPNPFYAPIVAQAKADGWRVCEMPGSHFAFLVEPEAVAATIGRVADQCLETPQ